MEEERRGPAGQRPKGSTNEVGKSRWKGAKPFFISESAVKTAWERVRKNKGCAGIDGESIQQFESNLERNLYIVWKRMNSGTYFPEPVRRVEIPKGKNKVRLLGIPTVRDRIAQEVIRARLEERVEHLFHEDSYGFRRGRSPADALRTCKRRCFENPWVLEVDIEQFFDSIDHTKLMKAVEKHSPDWMTAEYVRRWLKAGVLTRSGYEETTKGTPQGGVISPLLANIYLHYAFDVWMSSNHDTAPFERYADDMVIHCRTEEEAYYIRDRLTVRMADVGLRLHPEKTRVVYCKDSNRREDHPNVTFTFLGYDFKPRGATSRRTPGRQFTSFMPAAGRKAKSTLMSKPAIKESLRNTSLSLEMLALRINLVARGWFNYFTVSYPSGVFDVCDRLTRRIVEWVARKYRLARRRAWDALARIRGKNPNLFAHWAVQKSFGRPARAV